MRVVFLDRAPLDATLRPFKFAAQYTEYERTETEDILPRLYGADVAIANKVLLRAATLEQLPQLKLVAVAATGVDNVDVAHCRQQGIAVTNIKDYALHTVPEHCFALILALRRNLFAYAQDVASGEWNRSSQFCLRTHPISDLHGATLGIIGSGALGRGTAGLGAAFGMRVVFAARDSSAKAPDRLPLDDLLRQSDVISLHCPLLPETRNLIDIHALRKMKRSALLINTARGGLVDEAALLQGLDEGLIAGAGCDVLSVEPPRNGNPLLESRRPNLIVTPHVAWASDQAMQSLADQLIDNIECWAAGKPQHLVTS